MIQGLVLQSRGRLVVFVELEGSTFLVGDHWLQRFIVPAREGLVSLRVQNRLVREFCDSQISFQVIFTEDRARALTGNLEHRSDVGLIIRLDTETVPASINSSKSPYAYEPRECRVAVLCGFQERVEFGFRGRIGGCECRVDDEGGWVRLRSGVCGWVRGQFVDLGRKNQRWPGF